MAAHPSSHYDEIHFPNLPVPTSQPDRLATIGLLRGLDTTPPSRAKVLELGCATGQNLLPLADRYPEATFLGIDFSAGQIARAQEAAAAVGLTNVQFQHADIELLSAESLGTFDYIIAQGVYSWVPSQVRDKLLSICHDCLKPAGVAYVSYKTYPGWHVHDMLRQMMLHEGRNARTTGERIAAARGLLNFLADSLPEKRPYAELVRGEVELLTRQSDAYLRHDHLEETSQPVYYRQFVEHAREHQLQILGDGAVGYRESDQLAPDSEKHLHALTRDPILQEHFRDIVRNRSLRQTMLCRADAPRQPLPPLELMRYISLEAKLKPESTPVDLRSNHPAHFQTPHGGQLSTSAPLIKAALLELSVLSPNWIDFATLAAHARARVPADIAIGSDELPRLADNLVQCCLAGFIDPHAELAPFTTQVEECPRTSRLARWQAAQGDIATNRKHEAVRLDHLDRHVLQLLDGKHDAKKVIDQLVAWTGTERLSVWDQQQRVQDPERIRALFQGMLPESLGRLAQSAFLMSNV